MNAPLQVIETQLRRNAELAGVITLGANGQPVIPREFRLSDDLPGIGRAGEVVTLSVTPADTADQLAVIDNYISGYRPFALTAELVSPVVLVNKEKGKRLDRDKQSAFTVVETAVGREGHINEVQDLAARTDYATQEHALAAYIPWAAENDAIEQYDIRRATSQMLADLLLLAKEVRTWNFATTLNNWASTNRTTLGGTAKWDTGSAKNIRLDIQTRMDASSQPITDMFMNPTVAFAFLSDTDVRAYLRQFMGDNAPSPDLARAASSQGYISFELFGLPRVHVCPAKKLSSGSLVYVLGDDVVLTSKPGNGQPVDMFTTTSMLTFRVRGKSGTGWVTNEYLPNGRGLNGGRMLETGFGETTFMVSTTAGGLIKDVLA